MDPDIETKSTKSTESTESPKPRPLVVCFDGTSDSFDYDNTNVVKFFELLKKNDFNEQLCYYQPGIGTWYERGVVSPLFRLGAKILDEALAWHVDAHIMEGYKFIMKNYRQDDKICIFGFSRGAFIARALAGMLHKAGLLPRDNDRQVPFAYKLYKHEGLEGRYRCARFKQTFCQDVKVEFVGVWDTVSSVGTISGRKLSFTYSNDEVKTFRHALALDERRVKFVPECYRKSKDPLLEKNPDADRMSKQKGTEKAGSRTIPVKINKPGIVNRLRKKKMDIKLTIKQDDKASDVHEVWFSGCHCDVGGGATLDEQESSLSNISLRWMVREVQKSNCDILFDPIALDRAGVTVDMSMPKSAQSESEETAAASPISDVLQEKSDVDCKPKDVLVKNPIWWLLEVVPLRRWQDKERKWHLDFRPNFGGGRRIPDKTPNFHDSVRKRKDNNKKYRIRAKYAKDSVIKYVY